MRTSIQILLMAVLMSAESVAVLAQKANPPEYYANRIKTVDQFMSRFNRKDIPINLDSNAANLPLQQVITCFDFDYVDRNADMVKEFAEFVVNGSIKLDYTDTTWFAVAVCNVKIGKTIDSILLFLRPEVTSAGGYRWAIVGAEGDALELAPESASLSQSISPVNHELNFMQLKEITKKDYHNIVAYATSKIAVDATSVFFALVANGLLKINYVQDLFLHFDLPRYSFDVKFFKRTTNNSGWLIYNLKKL